MAGRASVRRGFTLIELLVVVAIIALLVSILLPSLGRAKELAQTIVCANRHKGTLQGWTYYQSDYNGILMAPWDRQHPWPGLTDLWPMQYPYTLQHYVAGHGIPTGETVWMEGHPAGPWYGPDGRHGFPPDYHQSPDQLPQMHCPEIVAMGPSTSAWWYNVVSLSYFIMGGQMINGRWRYNANYYPMPDRMTHPSTTGLHMCLSGIMTEGQSNAWCTFEGFPYNPHMEKSNYTFVDGHVETLSEISTNEYMWESMWERGGG